ncbi:2'-5' RNA ligase family protein [Oryzobacter terrae]|uniref:2'-5' RNA ligase family protein n=1 Tax=Oryzobacter terrae TaxID=1620385 RepID=UPI00366DF021
MLVTVALIPPEHVLDDVETALGRSPAPPGEFVRVARNSLMLPVFGLGNITRPMVTSLAHYIHEELDTSEPSPRVRFSGVWAIEEEGDPTIGLPLVGEVERVEDLARRLPRIVATHGFFVDRRRFQPRMTLGSVTPTTSLSWLERLVGDLEGHASPIWSVSEVVLLRPRFDDDGPEAWEVVETISTGIDPV